MTNTNITIAKTQELRDRMTRSLMRSGQVVQMVMPAEHPFMTTMLADYKNDGHWIYDELSHTYTLFLEDKEAPVDHNIYREAVIERLDRQCSKGLEKYGYRLQDNVTLNMIERLEHFAEEMTDGLQYIEHIKALHRDIVGRLAGSVSKLTVAACSIDNETLRTQLMDEIKIVNEVMKELTGYAPCK